MSRALAWAAAAAGAGMRPSDQASVPAREGVYIPTGLLRHAIYKLALDLTRLPSVAELFRAAVSTLMFGGDTSRWEGTMAMPHYNRKSMPAISAHTALHITQLHRSGMFRLFDHGPKENVRRYGQAEPPDIAGAYGLIDVPVDIAAGRSDGIISVHDVRKHR